MPRPSKGERGAFTTRMPTEELALLDAWCAAENLDRSEALTILVRKHVEEAEAVAPPQEPRRTARAISPGPQPGAMGKSKLTMADVRGPYKPNQKQPRK